MKFIIDRSTWRTGGVGKARTGIGKTYLRNKQGFCCCLGQIYEQLGVTKEETLEWGTPEDLFNCNLAEDILVSNVDGKYRDTDLAKDAMEINDDFNSSLEEKEKQLKELFKNIFELEFIGEPVRENI